MAQVYTGSFFNDLKWDSIILMRLIWPGALAHELGITVNRGKIKVRWAESHFYPFSAHIHILGRFLHIFALINSNSSFPQFFSTIRNFLHNFLQLYKA